MFCLFDFAPFLEYMEEIYQTHMEAESSKFLDVAAAHRKVARERRQAKQKMTVATIIFNIFVHDQISPSLFLGPLEQGRKG